MGRNAGRGPSVTSYSLSYGLGGLAPRPRAEEGLEDAVADATLWSAVHGTT